MGNISMRKAEFEAKANMSQAEMPGWLLGSEMGKLIFAHDWTDSGLGPISTWRRNLQFAVNIMLLMPSAVILLWGPKLIQIYNDGCRDRNDRHPDAGIHGDYGGHANSNRHRHRDPRHPRDRGTASTECRENVRPAAE